MNIFYQSLNNSKGACVNKFAPFGRKENSLRKARYIAVRKTLSSLFSWYENVVFLMDFFLFPDPISWIIFMLDNDGIKPVFEGTLTLVTLHKMEINAKEWRSSKRIWCCQVIIRGSIFFVKESFCWKPGTVNIFMQGDAYFSIIICLYAPSCQKILRMHICLDTFWVECLSASAILKWLIESKKSPRTTQPTTARAYHY